MPDVNITPTNKRAKGYGDHTIKFVGEVSLRLVHNSVNVSHIFLVVDHNHVSLLGRDVCDKLDLRVAVPDKVNKVNEVSSNVLCKYKDFLSPEYKSNVQVEISLPIDSNKRPIFCKARSAPLKFRELVKTELSRLECNGVITRVFRSKWACPIVSVLKPNGQIRICGDYSLTVNKCMDTVQYPLPTADEVISQIGTAKVFSKVDLQEAYMQLPLDESSKEQTTINTGEGLFRFNFLPYGVASSPALFQAFITQVLAGVEDIVIYQDDILLASSDNNKHCILLDTVLGKLKAAGVKVNSKKSAYFMSSIKYLGFVFDQAGVRPNPDKIKPILEAPAPNNVQQLQSYIGLCTFYSRFIPNFSTVMAPMYKLLRKGVSFKWGGEQKQSFLEVKASFKSNKVLRSFDPKLPTALETDSSSYGIGAVLLQLHGDAWHPVQFVSRTLNNAERNYSQIEREALSVVFGTQRLRQYLLGIKFIIKNDHRALQKLLASDAPTPTKCSARLQRWALRLSQFNYRFEYVKGSHQLNSDFLSRFPLKETEESIEPYEIIFALQSMDESPITCDLVKQHTDSDKNLVLLKQYIRYGFPSNLPTSLSKFKSLSDELSIMKGCIMFRNRVFIPSSLRTRVLSLMHSGHPGINAMKSSIRSLVWYPGIDNDVTSVVKQCKMCQMNRPKPSQNATVQWPIPNRVWSRVHIDHFFFESKICLIAIDSLSKYIECEVVPSVSAADTIQAMRLIFSRQGLCDVCVSDNSTSFTASEFKTFLRDNRIHHMTPPPYNSYSNGQAERAVRVIKDLLKKNKNGSFQSRLANVLLHYRSTPHTVTGSPPCVSLNKRKYVTIKDRINPLYVPCVKENLKVLPNYSVGQSVLALNLRDGPKWYQSKIVSVDGVNTYTVYIVDLDTTWRRHTHQLLPCITDNSTSNSKSKNLPSLISVPNCNTNVAVSSTPVVSNDQYCDDVSIPGVSNSTNENSTPVSNANVENDVQDSIVNPNPNVHNDVISSNPVILRRSTRIRKPVVRYDPV